MTQEEKLKAAEQVIDSAEPEYKKRHNLEPFRDSARTRKLRLWLNIIFMVGAAIGLFIYFKGNPDTAWIVLIVACVFKFIELSLRILKI